MLLSRCETRTLRHGPTLEHAVEFEAQIEVQRASGMLLYYIATLCRRDAPSLLDSTARLCGLVEVALLSVGTKAVYGRDTNSLLSPAEFRR
jgi:hypothetical protein